MMQVVDYQETFNAELGPFLKRNGIADLGFDYHVAAIMGPQSSGKSTLLNLLFGTSFRTMDADSGRYQVTQGVWLGRAVDAGIIVMDLEGTDSRERGEDAATYERKSALFALALSEVLIINIWTQDVGRLQAANLSLLKTVMELDLQLFGQSAAANGDGAGKGRMHKTRLLFVLRDHYSEDVGGTSLSRLESILRSDVQNIWNTISKPEAVAANAIEDYFDLAFFALPHKKLEAEKFQMRGQELKAKFHSEDEMFLPEYRRDVAADGFATYAESVWETVRANKELDIPSQKEMLAHVRCEQIARDACEAADRGLDPLREALSPTSGEKPTLVPGLYDKLHAAVSDALELYEASAFRYSKSVAELKAADMQTRIATDCKLLYDAQITLVVDEETETARKSVKEQLARDEPWAGWNEKWEAIRTSALAKFDQSCAAKQLPPEQMPPSANPHPLSFCDTSFKAGRRRLESALEDESTRAIEDINSRSLSFCLHSFRSAFKGPVTTVLDTGDDDVWNRVSEVLSASWEEAVAAANDALGKDGMGRPDDVVIDVVEDNLKPECYDIAVRDIKDMLGSEATFLSRMGRRFDDKFRFDANGVPRHFAPDENIEEVFVEARETGEKVADLLSEVKLTGKVADLRPSAKPISREAKNPVIFDSNQRQALREQLRRQAGAAYSEAKRAQEAAKITTKVPVWLFGVLLLLGWNEIMMVLRNPVLLILTVLITPVIYMSYTMGNTTMIVPAVKAAARPYIRMARDLMDEYAGGDEPAGPGSGAAVAQASAPAPSRSTSSVTTENAT